MAGLARRRGFRPGNAAGRERAVGEPQEGAWRSARCARPARAAHLRGAPARRRPDHARGFGGGVRHLARARASDRGARLPEGAAGGANRDRRQAAFLRDPLTERRARRLCGPPTARAFSTSPRDYTSTTLWTTYRSRATGFASSLIEGRRPETS